MSDDRRLIMQQKLAEQEQERQRQAAIQGGGGGGMLQGGQPSPLEMMPPEVQAAQGGQVPGMNAAEIIGQTITAGDPNAAGLQQVLQSQYQQRLAQHQQNEALAGEQRKAQREREWQRAQVLMQMETAKPALQREIEWIGDDPNKLQMAMMLNQSRTPHSSTINESAFAKTGGAAAATGLYKYFDDNLYDVDNTTANIYGNLREAISTDGVTKPWDTLARVESAWLRGKEALNVMLPEWTGVGDIVPLMQAAAFNRMAKRLDVFKPGAITDNESTQAAQNANLMFANPKALKDAATADIKASLLRMRRKLKSAERATDNPEFAEQLEASIDAAELELEWWKNWEPPKSAAELEDEMAEREADEAEARAKAAAAARAGSTGTTDSATNPALRGSLWSD